MNDEPTPAAGAATAGAPRRFPAWLTKRLPAGGSSARVRAVLDQLRVTTVCRHARCPNQGECFSSGTATFMIMGSVCTRRCGFCAVSGGLPAPLEADEPERVAEAARLLGLDYVVVTSVTRDDLPDGGAGHFAATIHAIRRRSGARVEVLTPDFAGAEDAIRTVVAAKPDVYNHNVETVPRLYGRVRPQADYQRSLALLRLAGKTGAGCRESGILLLQADTPRRGSHTGPLLCATAGLVRPCGPRGSRRPGRASPAGAHLRPVLPGMPCPSTPKPETRSGRPGARHPRADTRLSLSPDVLTKSGIMVGLGERPDEVAAVMRDLRAVGCRILTIGQYLRPSPAHLPVVRYVEPAEFDAWRRAGLEMGFQAVAAGPFVRSSYHAREVFTDSGSGL